MTLQTSRRGFLGSLIGAALVIGFDGAGRPAAALASGEAPTALNPFVRVGADGQITAIIKHFEMGQGTTTGLATLIAEEMDADWAAMRAEFAPSDNAVYQNLAMKMQGTGGSTAMANSWPQYRAAGAMARALLVAGAAKEWGVPAATLSVFNGKIKTQDGSKSAGFGEFVAAAAKIDPKTLGEPKLKDPKDFRLIGKGRLPRLDTPAKTNGSAIFAMDVLPTNALYVVFARPPRFGARLKSMEAAEARKVKGFVDAKETPRGVAVYADSTWAALKARDALKLAWDDAKAETRSTDELFAAMRASLENGAGVVARKAELAPLKDAKNVVEAEFVVPYLAHAPMEPLNCSIVPDGKGGVTLHDGCQFPAMAHPTVAGILGLPLEKVKVETVYAGGSFGRRANATSDYVSEAAFAFKATDGKRPVKLVWTREDDLAGGYYRSGFVHRARVALDEKGAVLAWDHAVAGQSIAAGTPMEAMLVKDGVDATSVEGIADTPYALPGLGVRLATLASPISVLWWRSVGHSHTAFVMESLMDMLAEKAKADPVEHRLKLLEGSPRLAAVLKLAAEKATWGKGLPEGRFQGVAAHESFKTYVAQVAEVSRDAQGRIRLERVICAVDCGLAVNPDVVKAQIEGSIVFAMGAAKRQKITFDKGVVEQANFPDYEPIRMSEAPIIEVHIVPSAEAPSGIGEPGVPPLAPAFANAIARATGKRPMGTPFADHGVNFA